MIAAVTRALGPNLARSAEMTRSNAWGPLASQLRPHAFGYSQSMSIPSNSPAHRGSLRSEKHESANAVGFAAACVNPPDHVQPPNDQITLRPGLAALSLRSWLKLPRSGWSHVSATPSTLWSAVYALSYAAYASPTEQRPPVVFPNAYRMCVSLLALPDVLMLLTW